MFQIPLWFLRRGSQQIHPSALDTVCNYLGPSSDNSESPSARDATKLELLLGDSGSEILPLSTDGNAEAENGNDEAYMAYLSHIIPAWAHKVAEAGPDLPQEGQKIMDDGEVAVPVRLSGWHQWKPDWSLRCPPKDRSRFTSNDWAVKEWSTHLTVLS